jgi:hypothetical protein
MAARADCTSCVGLKVPSPSRPGFIVALLAYCLGYQHGSFQRQQTKVETTASTAATPGSLRIGSLRMDDDPAIKYGTAPIRTER